MSNKEQGFPNCPQCDSDCTYQEINTLICPMCSHEWTPKGEEMDQKESSVVKDANGNILNDGDFVTVIKELKIKGASSAVKAGTKVKIRLIDEVDGHDIDCKIKGIGSLQLKSQFVRKVKD